MAAYMANGAWLGWLLFAELRDLEIWRAGGAANAPGEPLRVNRRWSWWTGSCCRGYGWGWRRSGVAEG
jgi:hypothetical protein